MFRVLPAIAVIVILASACGKGGKGAGDPKSCESIGAHYFEVVKAEIDKSEGDAKKNAEAMRSLLPKMKTQMVAECKKNEWPEETRKCLAAAKSASAGKACWKTAAAPSASTKSAPTVGKTVNEAAKAAPKAAPPDPDGM